MVVVVVVEMTQTPIINGNDDVLTTIAGGNSSKVARVFVACFTIRSRKRSVSLYVRTIAIGADSSLGRSDLQKFDWWEHIEFGHQNRSTNLH